MLYKDLRDCVPPHLLLYFAHTLAEIGMAELAKVSVVFIGLEWEAAEVAAFFDNVTVLGHEASTAPKWRDFAAQDIQEELEASFGWQPGLDGGDACDGASTLVVEVEGAPSDIRALKKKLAPEIALARVTIE